MSASAGVVVIGGGVAGCGIAWRLAAAGFADVLLVERQHCGAGATHAAAGMLTPEGEAAHAPALLTLSRHALARWPAFAAAVHDVTGLDPGLTRSGRVHAAFHAESLSEAHTIVRASDAHARALDSGAIRELEPALAGDVLGGGYFPDDASVDPRALIGALADAAAAAGARMIVDEALAVDADEHGVHAVTLRDHGRVATATVVVAAGAWADTIAGLPPTPAIRPVRGDMLAVQPRDAVLQHIVWGAGCYLVPRRNGRVIIGSTMHDAGFASGPSLRSIAELSAAAFRTCPVLAAAPVVETWAGLRPASTDGLPVLGADSRAPGVFHAGGLFRNGILLAPVVAEEIALRVMGRDGTFDLAPFAPERKVAA